MPPVYRPSRWLRDTFGSWLRRRRYPLGRERAVPVRQVRPSLERLEEVLPANALYSPFLALLPAAAAYSAVNHAATPLAPTTSARNLPRLLCLCGPLSP
jgi:hypothetical protein